MSRRAAILCGLGVLAAIYGVLIPLAASNDWSDRTTSVIALIATAVGVLFGGVWALIAAKPQSTRSQDADLRRAADDLCSAVDAFWSKEAKDRDLRLPAPILVRWEAIRSGPLAPEPADLLETPPVGLGPPLLRNPTLMTEGAITQLHELYERLPRGKLVITGDGGTGKTGALILLLLTATSRRSGRKRTPVPVLIPISDWRPAQDDDALLTWAARTIYRENPFLKSTSRHGNRVVERLLEKGLIALLLDGLDEMHDDRQKRAIRAIASETRFRIVLTTRPGDLERASKDAPPMAAEVVTLLPVSPPEAGRYLKRDQSPARRGQWAQVAEAMEDNPHGALAQGLDTPLWLSIARSYYDDMAGEGSSLSASSDPTELLQPGRFNGVASVHHHLLERSVEKAFRTGQYARHGRRYLEHFALQMGVD